jgi:hypothetical protein
MGKKKATAEQVNEDVEDVEEEQVEPEAEEEPEAKVDKKSKAKENKKDKAKDEKKAKAKEEKKSKAPGKPKKAKDDTPIASVKINCDQLSFNNDKDIDNLGRYLEERITPQKGLSGVVRNKNILELNLTKPVSKRDIKLYVTKYLHRAGIRLDYRVLGTYQGAKEKGFDFIVYPRKVFEV